MNRTSQSSPPAALAPMYGREHDLSRLLIFLRGGTRLLTLRGPGGIGKTTLALHLAQALREPGEPKFDHVQLIDLSAVRNPNGVLELIAASLPKSEPKGDPLRRIQAFASNRRTLLILDNFEQLLPAASEVGNLLSAAPTLQLLITSRAVLRLHDEVEYPVEPLGLAYRARDAASSAAVQLFVARVQAVQPSFALTATTTPQVVRLCEALEGVPLAIELAAVRMRSLSLGDLLARLEHPLQVLKADFRDRPERLRSLRAAVQWSYDLLSEEERAVFECCAVFDGPFTPEALAEVWGSPEVMDHAEGLLEQSLLQRVNGPETLWKMLQPLRELALEQLKTHPLVGVWRERHALHYLYMIEEHQRRWMLEAGDGRSAYLPHYPNIRAGLVWTTETRRSDLAYRYLYPVHTFWTPFGLSTREAPLVRRVMALPPPEDRSTLLRALVVSVVLFDREQGEARKERLHEILALSLELGEIEIAAETKVTLANVTLETGQSEQARELVQEAITELKEHLGDQLPTRSHLVIRGKAYGIGALIVLALGRAEEAVEYARQAAQSFQESGKTGMALGARNGLGYMLVFTRRLAEGQALLLSCLHDAVRQGLRGHAEVSLGHLTLVAAELRAWATLVQFVAFTSEPSWEYAQHMISRRIREELGRAQEALGEAAYQQAWTTGTGLSLEDVVDLADQLAHLSVSPVLQQVSSSIDSVEDRLTRIVASIRTFGHLQLPGSKALQTKLLLLLCYLAIEGPQPRRHLAQLFWLDATDPANRLSVALSRLRRTQPGCVEADEHRVWTDLVTDTSSFVALLEEGKTDQAAALYSGHFLGDFQCGELHEELEEWILATRESLARRMFQARLTQAVALAAQGQFGPASRLVEQNQLLLKVVVPEPDELEQLYLISLAGEGILAPVLRAELAEISALPAADSPEAARVRLRGLSVHP